MRLCVLAYRVVASSACLFADSFVFGSKLCMCEPVGSGFAGTLALVAQLTLSPPDTERTDGRPSGSARPAWIRSGTVGTSLADFTCSGSLCDWIKAQ